MIRLFRPPRWIDWFYPSFTWRFVVSKSIVFLTFDDGPHPDITPRVLDLLKEQDHKATFFCVGDNISRYPEIVDRILSEGHTIGNHTMWHTKGTEVSTEQYLHSVNEFHRIHPTAIFRPPYGKMTVEQRRSVRRIKQIIMWSWLSYDYDRNVSIDTILKKAETIRKGDVLVLHDNPKITDRQLELLPQLLKILKQKGLKSVPIT